MQLLGTCCAVRAVKNKTKGSGIISGGYQKNGKIFMGLIADGNCEKVLFIGLFFWYTGKSTSVDCKRESNILAAENEENGGAYFCNEEPYSTSFAAP